MSYPYSARASRMASPLVVTVGIVLLGLLFSLAYAAGFASGGLIGSAQGEPAAGAAGIGSPVRDGDLEFTVTSMDCFAGAIGSGMLAEEPSGKFCRVALLVRNLGDEHRSFVSSAQVARSSTGEELTRDLSAELAASHGADTFGREIEPGGELRGAIVFDVPEEARLTEIELRDGRFGEGASVSLG